MSELEQQLAQLRRRIEIGAETARPLGDEQRRALRAALAEALSEAETKKTKTEKTEEDLPTTRRQGGKSKTRDQDHSQGH
jgi:F0F1-type ATP synthase delta subunit